MTQRNNLDTADFPHRADAFAAATPGRSAFAGSSDSGTHVAPPAGRTRKAVRIAVSLPVIVRDQFGGSHQARTQFVTVRGAVLSTSSTVRVGHKLTIQNLRNNRSAECHVIAMERAVKDTHEVEVEFTRPQPDFWPVQFPTDDSRTQETYSSNSLIEKLDSSVAPQLNNRNASQFSSSIGAFSEPEVPKKTSHDDGIVSLADSLSGNYSPISTFRSDTTFTPRNAPLDSVAQFRAANRAAHRRQQAMKTLYSIVAIMAVGGLLVAGKAWIAHPSEITSQLGSISGLAKAKPSEPTPNEVSAPVTPATQSHIIVPSTKKQVIESASTGRTASNIAAAEPTAPSPEIASRPAETLAVRHGSTWASSRKAVREAQESDETPTALPLHAGDAANSASKPELLSSVVAPAPVKEAVLEPQVPKQVTPARLISSVPAQYPSIARQLRAEGEVVLDLDVDSSGTVSSAKAISGPPVLRTAALDAVKRWKYQPATLGDKPVSSTQTVKIDFHLK